jgi:hypothetical protein
VQVGTTTSTRNAIYSIVKLQGAPHRSPVEWQSLAA